MTTIPHIPADVFNATAAISRASNTYDALREAARSWEILGTVPARLDKFRYSGSQAAWAEQGIIDLPSHKLFCPAGTDVGPGDRITVASETFEVLEAFEPGGYAHHREVWVKYATD